MLYKKTVLLLAICVLGTADYHKKCNLKKLCCTLYTLSVLYMFKHCFFFKITIQFKIPLVAIMSYVKRSTFKRKCYIKYLLTFFFFNFEHFKICKNWQTQISTWKQRHNNYIKSVLACVEIKVHFSNENLWIICRSRALSFITAVNQQVSALVQKTHYRS